MAVSLYQSALTALNNGEVKRAAVIQTFGETSPLLAAIPQMQVGGSAYAWNRQASLGSAGTRAVGGTYTESAGTFEERTVGLKIYGGDLDIDEFLVKVHGPEHRAMQERSKAAYVAQLLGWAIVKGSVAGGGGSTADPHGMDGLQVRYGGGFGGTAVVDGGENAGQIFQNSGGSNALSLKDLDNAIMLTEGCNALLMPKKMRINITSFLRGSSSITQSKDEFGNVITSYAGIRILDADVLGTVSGLEQIGFNEGASTNRASVWCLNLSDTGLCMVTNGGVQVRDLGEQNSGPQRRTRVEIYCNIADLHPRCVSRLYDIADLTAVA